MKYLQPGIIINRFIIKSFYAYQNNNIHSIIKEKNKLLSF